MPDSARVTTYRDFLDALLKGEKGKARRFTTPGFQANLGKTKARLNFDGLVREIDRQRTAFPDLGKNIEVVDTVESDEENRIVITYRMTVHFTGTLTNGQSTIPGTGEKVTVPSQDRVDFQADGKIHRIEIVTDMGHTMAQMFPAK